MRYWIEMFLFMHLVFCTINIPELWTERGLKRKAVFALLILVVPVLGILMFHKARRSLGSSPGEGH